MGSVVPFYPFWGEGSPRKGYRKKMVALPLFWRTQVDGPRSKDPGRRAGLPEDGDGESPLHKAARFGEAWRFLFFFFFFFGGGDIKVPFFGLPQGRRNLGGSLFGEIPGFSALWRCQKMDPCGG